MKQKILAIMMVFFGMLLSASLAQAGQVTATHTVASQQQTANGVDVVLNITVNNQNASAFNSVTFDMVDLTLWAEPGTNLLTVGSLSTGESVNLVWSITSTTPSFMAGAPLAILVNAIDSSGQPVEFSIMSTGE